MASRVFLLFSLTTLLIFSVVSPSFATSFSDVDDEDLSFLEEEAGPAPQESFTTRFDEYAGGGEGGEEEEEAEMYEEEETGDLSDLGNSDFDLGNSNSDPFSSPEIDEKDVVIIKGSNFTDLIENNQYVLVEFFAPWCGHCQTLAPEYAAAATELKADGVVLAKIDAMDENELSQKYSVQGLPTIVFFVDGEHKRYSGGKTK